MARARKPQAPGVRSDGEVTPGSLAAPNQGQPNGRPRAAVTQTLAGAGAGGPMPYGMAGQLQQAAAQTPLPPGVTPEGHAAAQSLAAHFRSVQAGPRAVTPLMAPTERPFEPVTAGAPMGAGPTNPMALPQMQDSSIVSILQQAAQASPSPTLRALANRAAASLQDQAAAPGAPGAP